METSVDTSVKRCEAWWLGRVAYRKAWQLQNRLADLIAAGKQLPTLLLLEHPPTYTIGRMGNRDHLLLDDQRLAERNLTVVEVDRGGDITYHGPGQLVGYPILPLAPVDWQGGVLGKADFVGYLRRLEACLIEALGQLGVRAIRRDGLTGVWVEENREGDAPAYVKVASIGVKIDSRGITRHGFALNLATDMEYWEGIVPCGLEGVRMTNLVDYIAGATHSMAVLDAIVEAFGRVMGYEMVFSKEPEAGWQRLGLSE
ncbi:MAG TPA: lipoyl(octanoyl) transferase [Anaerolinea thermolimosa]|uniref:Octanoyltransferase n=1 Tax=Anaerolinea thermolimosa TaxID=229919 RepID=A0A3D1JI76_9CHLR|nr:lipoyl(octanoyl) transferase [Anaerolinea thermolimosa]